MQDRFRIAAWWVLVLLVATVVNAIDIWSARDVAKWLFGQEGAAWVQAIGSIGAILASVHLVNRQRALAWRDERHRTLTEREDVFQRGTLLANRASGACSAVAVMLEDENRSLRDVFVEYQEQGVELLLLDAQGFQQESFERPYLTWAALRVTRMLDRSTSRMEELRKSRGLPAERLRRRIAEEMKTGVLEVRGSSGAFSERLTRITEELAALGPRDNPRAGIWP